MNACRECGTLFKFCSSCKYSPVTFAKSLGYCCDRCCKQDLDSVEFYKWFRRTLNKTESCFERDVLRDCKEDLWVAWANREFERKYK